MGVDSATMRARAPLPACPTCGALARPHILMFGDVAGSTPGNRTCATA